MSHPLLPAARFVGHGCCRPATLGASFLDWAENKNVPMPVAECEARCLASRRCSHFELNTHCFGCSLTDGIGYCHHFDSSGRPVKGACGASRGMLCFAATRRVAAVCIVGMWRTMTHTAPSIREFVLEPLNADAFAILQSDGPGQEQHDCEVVLGPRSMGRCSVGDGTVLRREVYSADAQERLLDTGRGGECIRRRSHTAPFQHLTWLQQDACHAAIVAEEHHYRFEYATFAIIRTDMLFFARLPARMLAPATRKLALPPRGDAWGAFPQAAVTDNVLVGDRIAFEAIAKMWRLAKNETPLCSERNWISEQFQHVAFEARGVRVHKLPIAYCKIDVMGGCHYPGQLALSLSLVPKLLERRPILAGPICGTIHLRRAPCNLTKQMRLRLVPLGWRGAPRSELLGFWAQTTADAARDPFFCQLRRDVRPACDALGPPPANGSAGRPCEPTLFAQPTTPPPICADVGWRTAGCRYELRPGTWLRNGTTDGIVATNVVSDYGGLLDAISTTANIYSVLDAGGNGGFAAAMFATRWPGASIVTLEPDVSNYAILRLNTQAHRNVIPICAGLTNTSTRLAVQQGLRQGLGKEWQYMTRTSRGSEPSVPGLSARALRRALCVRRWDFVKIDIEGGERRVFEGDTGWLASARYVFVETHDDMVGGSHTAVVRALKSAGLSIVGVQLDHETVVLACRDDGGAHCRHVCQQWSSVTKGKSVWCTGAAPRGHLGRTTG